MVVLRVGTEAAFVIPAMPIVNRMGEGAVRGLVRREGRKGISLSRVRD